MYHDWRSALSKAPLIQDSDYEFVAPLAATWKYPEHIDSYTKVEQAQRRGEVFCISSPYMSFDGSLGFDFDPSWLNHPAFFSIEQRLPDSTSPRYPLQFLNSEFLQQPDLREDQGDKQFSGRHQFPDPPGLVGGGQQGHLLWEDQHTYRDQVLGLPLNDQNRVLGASPIDTGIFDPVLGVKYNTEEVAFFKPGRVFKVYWPRPPGLIPGTIGGPLTVRYFVVIGRKAPNSSSCLTIETYGSRILNKGPYSIIHTSREPSEPKDDESNLLKPIRVIPRREDDILDDMARLNYADIYEIDHSLEVYDFGKVNDFETLEVQFRWCQGFVSHEVEE